MAIGIDTCVHEGALSRGRTLAVLASGLDRIYPRRNLGLCRRIAAGGSVISEYPPGTAALPYHFPIRNRIVTGMAAATVIVEARAQRSGSLISATLAADQGREVLAVPGSIASETSAGTNALIRDGCRPLLGVADVFDAAGLKPPGQAGAETEKGRSAPARSLPDGHEGAVLLGFLETEPTHVDDLIERSGLDGARVMELLTALEIEGAVEQVASGVFARPILPPGGEGRLRV
jgi:DNA processing protein